MTMSLNPAAAAASSSSSARFEKPKLFVTAAAGTVRYAVGAYMYIGNILLST